MFSYFAYFFHFMELFSNKINFVLFLFCCIASDIGGYIFGKILKGPKLTKISPKKTISGAVGSIVCSSLTLYIIFLFLGNSNLKFLLIGAIVSIGCQFGDIFFSYLKRKAKLKDTGKFLPGHGGFLDRIDGILLGIPVGFVALKFYFNMVKKISILGSTGSIGRNVFKIIDSSKNFKINLLSANKNYSLICNQIKKYKPKFFIINNPNVFKR